MSLHVPSVTADLDPITVPLPLRLSLGHLRLVHLVTHTFSSTDVLKLDLPIVRHPQSTSLYPFDPLLPLYPRLHVRVLYSGTTLRVPVTLKFKFFLQSRGTSSSKFSSPTLLCPMPTHKPLFPLLVVYIFVASVPDCYFFLLSAVLSNFPAFLGLFQIVSYFLGYKYLVARLRSPRLSFFYVLSLSLLVTLVSYDRLPVASGFSPLESLLLEKRSSLSSRPFVNTFVLTNCWRSTETWKPKWVVSNVQYDEGPTRSATDSCRFTILTW